MFKKLFGETEELQIQYLKNKAILTGVCVAALLIALIFGLLRVESVAMILGSISEVIFIVLVFMYGFGAIKKLLGYGTMGAFFSGNIIIGSAILLFSFLAGCVIGVFIAALGTGRYIYLIVKKSQERR